MKWITLTAVDGEDHSALEWEAAGTVAGASKSEALAAAAHWPDMKHFRHVDAVPWTSANADLQQDAKYEDAIRREAHREVAHPTVAVVMLGVTTALVADLPVITSALERGLSRKLSESESAMVMFAYAAFLFEVCSHEAEAALPPPAASAMKLQLQTEFPALLSAGGDSMMPTDDWIEAVDTLFSDRSRPGHLGAREAALCFGGLVAGEIGMPGDPEIMGQAATIALATITKLRLDQIIGRRAE